MRVVEVLRVPTSVMRMPTLCYSAPTFFLFVLQAEAALGVMFFGCLGVSRIELRRVIWQSAAHYCCTVVQQYARVRLARLHRRVSSWEPAHLLKCATAAVHPPNVGPRSTFTSLHRGASLDKVSCQNAPPGAVVQRKRDAHTSFLLTMRAPTYGMYIILLYQAESEAVAERGAAKEQELAGRR